MHERLVDEAGDAARVRPRHLLCGGKSKRSGKHGQTSETGDLGVGQQLDAPVQQRPQRTMTAALIACQEAQTIVQPLLDVVDPDRSSSRRGEFECKGYTVESTADAGDG